MECSVCFVRRDSRRQSRFADREREDGFLRFLGEVRSEIEQFVLSAARSRSSHCIGIPPNEIGVFVRDRSYLPRARQVLAVLGRDGETLSGDEEHLSKRIALGTMHLAKGLVYRAVVVMACDDEALPLQSRIEDVVDEAELDEVYATERHLFYVACTRARVHLLVSGIRPVSEFLEGLDSSAPKS